MAIDLTKPARLASSAVSLEPQIVLEIDGVDTIYGARIVYKRVKIGDPGLTIGGGWKIGGLNEVDDQSDLISLSGTSTSIRQQLQPDKGIGSSISSMQIALVDLNGEATYLVSPGRVLDDVLGARARVRMGFQNTSYPADYVTVFRGIISDIKAQAGIVTLDLSHPDQKKRQTLFPKATAQLNGAIDDNDLVLLTDDVSFLRPTFITYGIRPYIKIDDEWMRVSGMPVAPDTPAYTVVRAQLGTTAAAHGDNSPVEVKYSLYGNVIDLALWLMLSSGDATEPYLKQPVTLVNTADVDGAESNILFFRGIDLVDKYGIRVGDTVAQWDGVTNFFSTVSEVLITDIDVRYYGTVVTVNSNVTLTLDEAPDYEIWFYSQYNVMDTGLGMKPDEVDIDEHLRIKSLLLSSFDGEIFLDDDENIKDLIEQQLYAPAGAYSLPRKSKASVGFHSGPIPGTDTKILSTANICNGSKLQVRRSISQNFANTIIYKYDYSGVDGEPDSGLVVTDTDSTDRIKVGTRSLITEARGIRTSLNGVNLATSAANRKLNRYKFAAEAIEQVKVLFKDGLTIEVGDIVALDSTGLNLLNSAAGDRSADAKLYEVINKTLDIRTGEISLSLLDTNFSTETRYALISPASFIKTGLSQTQFIIEPSFNTDKYGANEGMKWAGFITDDATIGVKVRSLDGTTRFAQTTLVSVDGNTVTVADALGFTPQAGDLLEFANYDFAGTSELQKALYGYMSDTDFADGGIQYEMI